MGSLSSRPSVPAPQPQVVFVPQPSPAPASTTNTIDTSTETQTDTQETASEARQKSLLGRERSRFGTIQTGFRGLLGLSDNTPVRKTLLGE